MGSCVSKCRPKKKLKKYCNCIEEDFSRVQDKLVISQPPVPIQNPVSPIPSAASSSSFSSVSGANSSSSAGFSMASSLSSTSSCSSSVSISKDRSFSNEFLWSCVKENPQIIGRNLIKGNLDKSSRTMSSKVHPHKFDLPVKQAIPEGPGGPTPKKRARTNSPTLVRQKSFRKQLDKVSSSPIHNLPSRTVMRSPSPSRRFNEESFRDSRMNATMKDPDKVISSPIHHLPSRTVMRSPSPSRRFNEESFRDSTMNTTKDIYSRRSAVPKGNSINPAPSIMRNESFRTPPSPKYDLGKNNTILKSRETLITHQIGLRNGENAVTVREANQDVASMVVEDINNPLIALDCFVFL